jgi:hypothetical protein
MTQGVIHGGWEFVWAAYTVSAVVFTAYTISLAARLFSARIGGGKRT